LLILRAFYKGGTASVPLALNLQCPVLMILVRPYSLLLILRFVALSLLLTMGPSLSQGAISPGKMQCRGVFEIVETAIVKPGLISMNEMYRGEDQGLYMDPLDKKPWTVKYFTEAEKAAFQVFLNRDGTFKSASGKPATSVWDNEFLRFDEALFIIDKDGRIFVMPFEARGVYHHSSLSSGQPVLYAGTIAFYGGYLRLLSDKSGHYKPSPQQSLDVIRYLHQLGVNLTYLRLEGGVARYLNGAHSLEYKNWQPLIFK